MTHSDDDYRPRHVEGADGTKLLNAEERKKRFARAIARAEFGRFYWREDPAERVRNGIGHPGANATMAKLASRPKGSAVKVRKG